MWKCLRLAETLECFVRVIKDMYDEETTTVKCAAGLTEKFKVGVRLHQGSALSPFLFANLMYKLTGKIKKEAPWDMMFPDDIVLSRQNHGELKEDLEIRRNGLEKKRPESEPVQDRIFKSWRCRRWRKVEIARGCSKESEKL